MLSQPGENDRRIKKESKKSEKKEKKVKKTLKKGALGNKLTVNKGLERQLGRHLQRSWKSRVKED